MGDVDKRAFGRRVRERRDELGWKQPRLSRESGISQQHISFIERGKLENPERRALELAKALQTTVEWLLREEGPRGTLPPIMSPGEIVDDYGGMSEIDRRRVSELFRAISASRRHLK